jgi:hypothetical protein
MVSGSGVVSQEPQLRTAAVCQPQVEVSVKIPIDRADRAGVVREIEAADGGNVGESAAVGVEITTVPLIAA